ncbi:MAG: hypothetical protein ACO3JI_08500 [Steroidobacteraceae bacterium]|jgi:hypothetical protein
MSNDLNDWTNLQGLWRERSDERETLEHFRTLAAREKKRLHYEIAAEAALSIVSAAIFVWWATDARGFGRVVLLALSAFAIAMPAVTALVRRSVWRAQADTAESYRNFLHRRARLGLLVARLGYIGGPLGIAVGFLLAGPLGIRASAPGGTGALVVACLAFVAVCGWSLLEARKWRLVLERLDAFRNDGFDDDLGPGISDGPGRKEAGG